MRSDLVSSRYADSLLLILLAGGYFLLFGRHGYYPTDQGFIPGLAWRVWSGQVPFQDFIYVRPPMSAWLHAWEGGSESPIFWGRLGFFLQMALVVGISLRMVWHFFPLENPAHRLWLILVAWVLSIHNFPSMPWHTVDGLMLSAIGIALIVLLQQRVWGILGMGVLVGAALCKQSFYPAPLVGIWLLLTLQPWPKGLMTALISVALWGGGFAALVTVYPSAFVAALAQTRGATSWGDLLMVGGWNYLKALPGLALGVAAVEASQKRPWRKYLWLLWSALLVGGASIHLLQAIRTQDYVGPMLTYGQLLWWVALAATYSGWRKDQNPGWALGLALVGIGWMSSISWGYATPMLMAGPLVLLGYIGVQQWNEGDLPQWALPTTASLVMLLWAGCYLFPYREAPRWEAYRAGSEVFPKLAGIQLGPESYARMSELARFHQAYGDRFTVLPAYPAAHLLADAPPVFPSDWAQNAEVNALLLESSLQSVLDKQVAYVFLQKDKLDRLDDPTRYGCLLGGYIQRNWEQVEEGEFLLVFRNPRLTAYDHPGLARK